MDYSLKRLHEAAYANDVHSLEELLKEDHLLLDRVITTTEVNDNPLHVAAILGHAGFAREILKRKARLAREFNSQGMSPLHLAAAEGHLEVADVLLQVDPDLCYVKEIKDGYLPVHIAVMKGRHDIVTFLIEKCKDSVKELTYMSETLLHIAVKAKRSEMVEFFTAQGVMQLMLNEKDGNGNTVLHLAFAGRQRNVIKHLLSQENIDVNSMNLAGLTPLDVLLVSNHEMGDLYLGECLRAAGGKTAKELGVSEINIINSSSVDAYMTTEERSNKQITETRSKGELERYNNIENNLIVVATLVATVTFAAALNPPGGSIQMSFDDSNRKDPDWFRKWKHMNTIYPAGSPVYLWKLRKFFVYDYLALFTSVSVILLCLPGVTPKASNILIKKFLVLVLWCSIFFMIKAFKTALSILLYTNKNDTQKFQWINTVFKAWVIFFALISARLIVGFVMSVISKLKGDGKDKQQRQGRMMRNICTPKVMELASIAPWFLSVASIFIFVGIGIGWTIFEMATYPAT